MAQTQYRANLAAKDFTFIASQWGRTIIVKQFDQNFSRQIVSPTDPDKDIGIPQIYYCHNVMPSGQGFQSVSQELKVPNPAGVTSFMYIRQYTESYGDYGYLGFVANGAASYDVYRLSVGASAWVFTSNIPCVAYSLSVFVANVNGLQYVLIPQSGCYYYFGFDLALITLTGLDITTINGIVSSFGYLVAWSNNAIAWSSLVDPTDFTPSLITGAGGGSVQALLGEISLCYHHVFGFVVYSAFNAVAVIYSGNSRYPFNFREVIGAGGLLSQELIGFDADTGNQYAWTTNGLQLVSTTQAINVFPELTNFIGGNRFEDFDTTALALIETDVTEGTMVKKLTVVSNRYLVISYGVTQFTHALVYDIGMRRWGKLKITHVSCFQYNALLPDQTARTSLAFVDINMNVYVTTFSISDVGASGVMLLGKYQHTRNRLITLHEVDPEVIQNINDCKVYDLMTLDGKTFLPAYQLIPSTTAAGAPVYTCRKTALNHSLLFVGNFALDSMVLSYTPNGRR